MKANVDMGSRIGIQSHFLTCVFWGAEGTVKKMNVEEGGTERLVERMNVEEGGTKSTSAQNRFCVFWRWRFKKVSSSADHV